MIRLPPDIRAPDLRPHCHAFDARDWERHAAFCTEHASFEDRRIGGFGQLDRDGLPIGIQMVGKRWDESRLLAMAKALSEVTGAFQRPPGY